MRILIRNIGRKRGLLSLLLKPCYKASEELTRHEFLFEPQEACISYTARKACQPKHYREDLVGEALVVLQSKHEIKREHLFLQTKYYEALTSS